MTKLVIITLSLHWSYLECILEYVYHPLTLELNCSTIVRPFITPPPPHLPRTTLCVTPPPHTYITSKSCRYGGGMTSILILFICKLRFSNSSSLDTAHTLDKNRDKYILVINIKNSEFSNNKKRWFLVKRFNCIYQFWKVQ